MAQSVAKQRARRQKRTRGKMHGSKTHPRVSVFRSNKHLYAQFIDDDARITILGVSDAVVTGESKGKTEKAKQLGLALAKKAKEKKITKAVFDRGHYAYHGRVKAIADGLREGGLQF